MGTRITLVIDDDVAAFLRTIAGGPRKQGAYLSQLLRDIFGEGLDADRFALFEREDFRAWLNADRGFAVMKQQAEQMAALVEAYGAHARRFGATILADEARRRNPEREEVESAALDMLFG